MSAKPQLRIIHHLARTGGTLISRCLGSMKNIVLLSELHPQAVEATKSDLYNPISQASKWHGLIDQSELSVKRSFAKSIELIYSKSMESNKVLVIRNWAQLDYMSDFLKPSYTLTVSKVLADYFDLIQVATVRHPIDQWVSYYRLLKSLKKKAVPLAEYLFGYSKFAEQASQIGFIKYEDFVEKPDIQLKQICDLLRIEFDSNYKNNWWKYNNITGDLFNPSFSQIKIENHSRWSVDEQLKREFKQNSDYKKSIQLLGYSDV